MPVAQTLWHLWPYILNTVRDKQQPWSVPIGTQNTRQLQESTLETPLSYFLITRNRYIYLNMYSLIAGRILKSIPASSVWLKNYMATCPRKPYHNIQRCKYMHWQLQVLSRNTSTQQNIKTLCWEMNGNFYSIILMRIRWRLRQEQVGKDVTEKETEEEEHWEDRDRCSSCFQTGHTGWTSLWVKKNTDSIKTEVMNSNYYWLT